MRMASSFGNLPHNDEQSSAFADIQVLSFVRQLELAFLPFGYPQLRTSHSLKVDAYSQPRKSR